MDNSFEGKANSLVNGLQELIDALTENRLTIEKQDQTICDLNNKLLAAEKSNLSLQEEIKVLKYKNRKLESELHNAQVSGYIKYGNDCFVNSEFLIESQLIERNIMTVVFRQYMENKRKKNYSPEEVFHYVEEIMKNDKRINYCRTDFCNNSFPNSWNSVFISLALIADHYKCNIQDFFSVTEEDTKEVAYAIVAYLRKNRNKHRKHFEREGDTRSNDIMRHHKMRWEYSLNAIEKRDYDFDRWDYSIPDGNEDIWEWKYTQVFFSVSNGLGKNYYKVEKKDVFKGVKLLKRVNLAKEEIVYSMSFGEIYAAEYEQNNYVPVPWFWYSEKEGKLADYINYLKKILDHNDEYGDTIDDFLEEYNCVFYDKYGPFTETFDV